jgi:hypothetical protein
MLRHKTLLLGALAIALTIGGAASAGFHEVTYDLTGSTLATTSPASTVPDIDVVSGTFKLRYDAPTAVAPITGARLVAGTTHTTLSQPIPGLLTISGITDTTLLPAAGGTSGVIGGATLSFPVDVPDSKAKGFNHCAGPFCGAAGFTASVNNPLTPPRPAPFTMPSLVFTGAGVGSGDFTSTTKTRVITTNVTVTLQWIFKGKEVARYWISGDVPALSNGALGGLAAILVLGGTSTLALRRRR